MWEMKSLHETNVSPSTFSHINTPVHHSCDLLHQTNLQVVPCMADRHHAQAASGDRRTSKGTGKHATVLPEAEAATAPPPSAPCGACKFLRRKCADGCIFAPYFGSDQGSARFAAVHKVFGASNVSKLLLHIPVNRRHDAVVTISYEAQARLSDPVYGCVSTILALQQQVSVLQAELALVQNQLMNSRLAMSNALQNSQLQQQQQLQMALLHQPAYSNNSSNSNNIVNLTNFTSSFDLMHETTPASHLQLSRPSAQLDDGDGDEQESKTISAIFSCTTDHDLISRR